MRSEGLAQECKVVEFDLGGAEDAQEERKVGQHAQEESDMDCEGYGGEDGERVRLLRRPRTPTKLEWERHVVSQMPFRDCCSQCVAGRGLERRHQHPGHDDQYPLVCIVGGHLSGDVTRMLVVKDRQTEMVFPLPVERKGAADPYAGEKLAEWVDVLRSTQVMMRSDGEPDKMQVAATVSVGRITLAVTTLETSAPSDHG